MIITDYNKMTIEELRTINRCLRLSFKINDGKIKGVEVAKNDRNQKG